MALDKIKSVNESKFTPSIIIPQDETVLVTSIFQNLCEFLEGLKETIANFFHGRTVKKLKRNDVLEVLQKTTSVLGNLKKTVKRDLMIAEHQTLLRQPISALEKIKNFVSLPQDLIPFLDIFFAKGTQLNLDIGIEDNLTFSTDLNFKGVKGKVEVTLPTAAAQDAAPIDLDPRLKALLGAKLSPVLSKGLDINQIIELLLTIPSQTMSITCSKGTADITLNLPSGAVLKLAFELSKAKDDIVRTFLKSVLKENFAGIEPLLAETFTFTWDGSTSQFKLNFLQQQTVRIDTLKLKGDGPLQALASKIGKNGTIVMPQTIAGTVDFKKASIQFEPGTKLVLKDFLPIDKDIDLHQVAFDVEKNTVFLSIACFGDRTIPIKLDTESSLEKIDFKFIPIVDPRSRKIPERKQAAAQIASQQKPIPVFNQIKNLIKIPEAFASLVDILFARGTKLHAEIDIQDNIVLKTNVNIPGAGITGKASLTMPMSPAADAAPVKINKELLDLVSEQLVSEEKLLALLTLLPSQDIHINWAGSSNAAGIVVTLPGGATLNLDLHSSKDLVHNLLKTILKANYDGIAPLLQQDFIFNWTAATSTFKVKFAEQQVVHINKLKLKGEGLIQDIVGMLINTSQIVIPQIIEGKVNFEEASVKFSEATKFILKGILPFAKEIGFDQMTFRAKDNAIDLQVKCFGTHQATIDLNTSNVDSVDVDILPYMMFMP